MEHQRLTNKEVKKKNRNQIFRYICTHGTVSNPDIVSDLHLSLPTVTNTTRELLESGLLRDLGEMQSTGGRRARALCAASDYRFSIGLDITRNHLGILLLNLTGDIIKYERIQLGFSRSSAYFSEVCQKIDDFLLETEISGEPDPWSWHLSSRNRRSGAENDHLFPCPRCAGSAFWGNTIVFPMALYLFK